MPQVPKYNSPQIQESNLPQVQYNKSAPAGAFGVGAGLSHVIKDVDNFVSGIVREEKQKADKVQFNEASAQLTKLETDLMYSKDYGALNKKGKETFDAYDKTIGYYDNAVQDIRKNLNPDVQLAFDKNISDTRNSMDRQLQRHMFSEKDKYETEVLGGLMDAEQNAAVENFHDKERVGQSVTKQLDAIRFYGQTRGWSKEQMDQELTKAQSATHLGVLDRYLSNGLDEEADKYLQEIRDVPGALVQKDLIKIEKALEEGKLRGFAQRETDKLLGSGLSAQDALEAVKKISDPKKRDELTKEVKARFQERDFALEADRKKMFEDAFNLVDKSGDVKSIKPSTWADLSPTQKKSIEDWAAHRRMGTSPESDLNTYYLLEQMAGSPATRKDFLNKNLLEYRPKLSTQDFKKLSKLQSSMRKGGDEGEEFDGIESKVSIVNGMLNQMKIKHGPDESEENNQRANLFRAQIDKRVMQEQAKLGRKVNNEELRGIVNSASVELITKKGWIFDDKKRYFEITVDDVPESEKKAITEALSRQGKKATDAEIERFYKLKLIRNNKNAK